MCTFSSMSESQCYSSHLTENLDVLLRDYSYWKENRMEEEYCEQSGAWPKRCFAVVFTKALMFIVQFLISKIWFDNSLPM